MEKWLETKQMKLTRETLKRIIKEELKYVMNESDRFKGQIPDELWAISDYEDARDEGMLGRLVSYSDEELEMKIEQLEEEIEDEKNYMDDPQNQYDSVIAPKEALINFIQNILDQGVHQRPMEEGMGPDHPDYDMLGGIISRVLMSVLMRGTDIDSAMDDERVPEEHRDYVRQRVMAMSGR